MTVNGLRKKVNETVIYEKTISGVTMRHTEFEYDYQGRSTFDLHIEITHELFGEGEKSFLWCDMSEPFHRSELKDNAEQVFAMQIFLARAILTPNGAEMSLINTCNALYFATEKLRENKNQLNEVRRMILPAHATVGGA